MDRHALHQQEHAQPVATLCTSATHLAPASLSPSYAAFSKSQSSLLSGLGEKLSSGAKAATHSTPTPAPAKTKSRLNLRNPMSLLMRRRSAQSLLPLADESLATIRQPLASSSMPDNYDPSIRGNIIHDFNAPRLNKNYSYNHTSATSDAPQDLGRVSPSKVDRDHTPVFHEHFDDSTSYEQSQAAIRAETLVNKDFLARNSVQFLPPTPPLPPPVSPPRSPSLTPPEPTPAQAPSTPPKPVCQVLDTGSTGLSPVQETPSPGDFSVQVTPNKRRSAKSPPSARSRATSITDPMFQPAGLPTHLSSRASRFSFQISGGSDSTQEKLLEERHKAKAAQKASQNTRTSTNSLADEYDEYDMDDCDMDGGYDEEIPMIGEEDAFEGLGNQTLDSPVEMLGFSSAQSLLHDNDDTDAPSAFKQSQQPLDRSVNPTSSMMTEATEPFQPSDTLATDTEPDASAHAMACSHFSGRQNTSSGLFPAAAGHQLLDPAIGPRQPHNLDKLDLGDDMYFDDGLIGDQDDAEPAVFDEEVFDDPEGPLYERKVKFSQVDEATTSSNPSRSRLSPKTGYEADDDPIVNQAKNLEPSLARKMSVMQQRSLPEFNDMNAYHSALAEAANRAEASGRFARKDSVDSAIISPEIDKFSMRSTSRPSLVPDDGRQSLDTDAFAHEDDVFGMGSGYVDDYDYSDFDSAMEDDPIIAAANAEVLAYDDEGFYGQEFGFYASGAGGSSSMWGGFFGSSGLGRAPSGRNAVREPNLTPITERSEYSTRNSFISLNHFRDGNPPLSSPGLAPFTRMSPYGWPESSDDMSLDALMKLRKGAFGSNVVSLPASTPGSPRTSSPMGMQFVPRSSSPAGNRMVEQSETQGDEEALSLKNTESPERVEIHEKDEEVLTDADAVKAEYEEKDVQDVQDVVDEDGLDQPRSPTLNASDYNSLSKPARHSVGNEAPLLPPIAELYAQHKLQLASNTSLAMSPGGLNLTSAANVTLPTSPYETPLASPMLAQNRPTAPPAPPAIDTSLSSPAAATWSCPGPRRPSLGFVSPISSASPLTPSGSAWKDGHSRKGSATDSVAYVREHDESGEERWVLERRRTVESGELELVGREVIEGGRI